MRVLHSHFVSFATTLVNFFANWHNSNYVGCYNMELSCLFILYILTVKLLLVVVFNIVTLKLNSLLKPVSALHYEYTKLGDLTESESHHNVYGIVDKCDLKVTQGIFSLFLRVKLILCLNFIHCYPFLPEKYFKFI